MGIRARAKIEKARLKWGNRKDTVSLIVETCNDGIAKSNS